MDRRMVLVLTTLVNVGLAQAAPTLAPAPSTRIADPKIAGASISAAYVLGPAGQNASVTVTVLSGGFPLATVFSGTETGSTAPKSHAWNGRRPTGAYASPGHYTLRVTATNAGTTTLDIPLDIVRLGITEIEALPNGADTEWQMVYYRKGATYAYYATPAIHEYLNVAEAGDVSDLDHNDGSPRAAVPVHTDVATPVMEGTIYDDDRYNYPLAYRMGTSPIFNVTFGATATTSSGQATSCGYPVAGYALRCVARDLWGTQWVAAATTPITPGGTMSFTGPPLPAEMTKAERTIRWSWQYRPTGGLGWTNVPGELVTKHRFYTTIGTPRFATGATGTQYTGPWVEVADHFKTFKDGLGLPTGTAAEVMAVMIRGYFGQNGTLPQAIEGVKYDCPSVGGDGGATHYYSFGNDSTQLSRLLHAHANGVFVNCSDVASTSAAMLAMLGMDNVRMVYLDNMTLRAIWGIGTPSYTLNLWGGSHSFSYHHIITRNAAANVSDACLNVDEDGAPNSLPGTPGWNHDRPWAGASGYEALVASNNVTYTVQNLPKIQ